MSHLEDWSYSEVDREFCSLLLSSGLLERISPSDDTADDTVDTSDAGQDVDGLEETGSDSASESSDGEEGVSADDISDLEEALAKIFEAQVTFLGPVEDNTATSDPGSEETASTDRPSDGAYGDTDPLDAAFTAGQPGTLGASLAVAGVVAVVLLIVSLNPALALIAAAWVAYLGVVLWLDERFCAPGPAAA